jgi:lysophospholipase L1-like esterase
MVSSMAQPDAPQAGTPESLETWFPHTLAVLKARLPLTVLALGDSIPWGAGSISYRASFVAQWTSYLQAKYDLPVRLVNFTLPGRTTIEGLDDARFGARSLQPDLTVVAFGINDQKPAPKSWYDPRTWRERPVVPLRRFAWNIGEIADRVIRGSGGDVILVTPCPLPSLPDNEAYRAAIVSVARRHGFALADVAGRWNDANHELLEDDWLHPNAQGHRVYAETLIELGL